MIRELWVVEWQDADGHWHSSPGGARATEEAARDAMAHSMILGHNQRIVRYVPEREAK